jgi:hypothetical protein
MELIVIKHRNVLDALRFVLVYKQCFLLFLDVTALCQLICDVEVGKHAYSQSSSFLQ